MKQLRPEIHAAFEREQAAHPPAANLRSSIAQAVSSQPRPERNLQWIAVAAAVVLAVLVVGGLMATRLAQRTNQAHPQASPKARVSPTPLSDYGPPPEGVALIYLQDPNHPGWLIGFDWNGNPRGTVKLATPIDPHGTMVQAPDGSAFAYAPSGKGGYQQFLDRLGQPVASEPPFTYQLQLWADDNKHLCTLSGDGKNWNLGLRLPGAPATTSVVALDPSLTRSGIIAFSLVGCSAVNDRAVIAYAYMGVPTTYWVVRISDGKILSSHTTDANQVSDVVVSRDGSLVAENSMKSTGFLAGGTAPYTAIHRASDGALVMNLDPTYGVLAFSQDDSVALVYTSPLASGVATHLALITLQTGTVLWRSDGQGEFVSVVVQPDGSGFAVLLERPASDVIHPAVSLLIVRADGTTTAVRGTYLRP